MKSIPLEFTIHTQRLRLRAANEDDIDFVWSATRFEGFNEGLTWNAPTNKFELIEPAQRNLDSWKEGRSYMFTSELTENNRPVGRTGLSKTEIESEWSFGFWTHPNYWGNGFAAEAGRAVLQFGFSQLSASKILTAHATRNTSSKRVIEKLGFTHTGENPCGFKKNGKPIAEHEYEMLPATL